MATQLDNQPDLRPESIRRMEERPNQTRPMDDEGAQPLDDSERDSLQQMEDNYDAETPDATYDKPSKEATKPDDSGVEDDDSNWKTAVDKGSSKKTLRGRFVNRRNAVLVTIGTVTAAGGIGSLFLTSGPAQFVQLGKVLDRFSAPMDRAIARRMGNLTGMSRYLNTGEIGQTRVSWLGARKLDKIRAQLASQGVEIIPDQNSGGRRATYRLNPTLDPELRGKSHNQIRAALAERYGVNINSVSSNSDSGFRLYDVDGRNMSTAQANRVHNSLAERVAGDSRVRRAMTGRLINKFMNTVNPLRHPIRAADSALRARLETRSARIEHWIGEKMGKFKPRLPNRYATSFARMKSAAATSGIARAAQITTAVQLGVCFLHDVAVAIPELNYAEVIAPAAAHSTHMKGLGSQVQANAASIDGLAVEVEAFTDDEGNNLWASKALNAITYGTAGVGVDMEDTLKAAFYATTTSASILGGIGAVTETNIDFGIVSFSLEDALCNRVALGVGMTIGIASIFMPGPGWAARAATAGAGAVAAAAAMNLISDKIIEHETAVLEGADYMGVSGGNIAAWGSRAEAGMYGRAAGGIALSDEEEKMVMADVYEQERQEFQQKSLAQRLFDPYETRSLVGTAVRSPISSPTGTLASIANLITRPNGIFSSLARTFSQKAFAQEEGSYDWGDLHLYSLPREILDDPAYDSPIENAEITAGILNSPAGGDLISRAERCFGVKIARGTHGWDAIPERDPNPAEQDYIDGRCNELDDNWKRVITFVFDSVALITPLDCYTEDEDNSCARLGFGDTRVDTAGGPGSAPLGIAGLNGYEIPCTGKPAPVTRIGESHAVRASWEGVQESGSLGTGTDGQPIKVYIRKACDTSNVKTIVIAGSIHGTENGGQLVAWEMLFNEQLPSNVRVVAIPQINGWGVANVTRKNAKGVDLNRNFASRWREQTMRPGDCSEASPDCSNYAGPSPGSELETQAVVNFMQSLGQVSLFVSYHDNIYYVGNVGDADLGIAEAYARAAGMHGQCASNPDYSATISQCPIKKVSQHGSMDEWVRVNTNSPSLLIELGQDQSEAQIRNQVAGLKAAIEAAP